jgi:5'-3' exonuclease
VTIRGADRLAKTLADDRELAMLFKDLATLRTDAPLFEDVEELRWPGPRPDFSDVAKAIGEPELSDRAAALASASRPSRDG